MEKSFLALARKYRPKKLSELIGQEVFVSTVKNAVDNNRMAHAYLLCGVRGVGKTTAARILAHLFNGEKEATGNPMDLQEVDAARYTGVNEMRELLDGIKYRPSSWKYKVYILDEVHMLSTSAVSSLLKNLEEPPGHVKFIFCTTEPRKIPATIISRCQRFDLKRIKFDVLAKYLQEIASKENSEIELGGAGLIARAADGSVRDALSILDKSLSSGLKKVSEKQVRELLGLVDRNKIYSLFENLMSGKPKEGLEIFNELYESGADPSIIIEDLLEVTHWLSRLTVTVEVADEPGVSEIDKKNGIEISKKLNMAELSKVWQLLLKGYQEVQNNEMPNVVAQMVLIRLAYASQLPSVEELAKNLTKAEKNSVVTNGEKENKNFNFETKVQSKDLKENYPDQKNNKPDTVMRLKREETLLRKHNEIKENVKKEPVEKKQIEFSSFKEVTNLFLQKKEILIFNHLYSHVRLVKFTKGKIELNPGNEAPKDLASKVGSMLHEWTGDRWLITMSQREGNPTLEEQDEKYKKGIIDHAKKEKIVKEILEVFPGATIESVKEKEDKKK